MTVSSAITEPREVDEPVDLREHRAVRGWLISGAFWLMFGVVWGLLGALHLAAPDMLGSHMALSFGRMRPAHVQTVTFGFVGMSLIGSLLYFVPRVQKTRLQGEPLCYWAMWLWNAAVGGGMVGLILGATQAREYAEYVWWADVCITAALVLLAISLLRTILARGENTLYVTTWYFAGAVFWTAMMYPIGNVIWRPESGALSGTVDAVWLWFYGHNIFGLFLTPMAVGVFYYLIPRLARTPLYSHVLSLVGFWSLLFFYTHIGTHHLLQAPVPTWLKEISIVDSVAMMIPVLTALVNLWLTMRGRLDALRETAPGRIVFASTIWYLIVSGQGSIQSLPSVQRYTHFTHWVVGHAHIAVLGFAGLAGLAGLWHVLPLVCGRKLWSETLVDVQYWLITAGVAGFFIVLSSAGLVQGGAWAEGQTVYETVWMVAPYMFIRALFGVLIFGAAFIGFYNLVMTCRRGERIGP